MIDWPIRWGAQCRSPRWLVGKDHVPHRDAFPPPNGSSDENHRNLNISCMDCDLILDLMLLSEDL